MGPVLIVEDADDVREAIRDVLAEEGYAVGEACNGQEALDYLAKNPAPCLILLDLMMPVMDGLSFLKVVMGDPALCDVPVLLVSAKGPREMEAAVKSSGAAGFLTKPVQLKDLMDAVGRFAGAPPLDAPSR